MKIKKRHIIIALKLLSKKQIRKLSELSEKEFVAKVRSNPKTKEFSDDIIKLMYKELIKK